jgi:hypothetical protein
MINSYKIALAKCRVMTNEKDVDLESLYEYLKETKSKASSSSMKRNIGELLLNTDERQIPYAEQWINKSIEEDKLYGMMWHLGRDYALYAELSKRKGNQSKSKKNMNKAIEIMKECGADGWVQKYEKELAAL